MNCDLIARFKGVLVGGLVVPELMHQSMPEYISVYAQLMEGAIAGDYNSLAVQKILQQNLNLEDRDREQYVSQIALAIAPLILFYHEHPQLLARQIDKISGFWANDSHISTELVIWSEAIALCLRDRLELDNFPNQLLKIAANNDSKFLSQLQTLNSLFKQKSTVAEVLAEISHPLIFAYYCFIKTSANFALAVGLARLYKSNSELSAALTSMLIGAYHGYPALPIAWRLALKREHNAIAKEIVSKIEAFLAAWSGVYQPNHLNFYSATLLGNTAAPNTIQSRSQLHF